MTQDVTTLTVLERNTYGQLKDSISAKLKIVGDATEEIGNDLKYIKDHKLYREEYTSFAEFVEAEYGKSARWAYQQLDHVRVLANIEHANPDSQVLPTTKQTRELSQLPDEEQAEAWQESQQQADSEGKEAPTASDVKETVRKRKNAMGGEYENAVQKGEQNVNPGSHRPSLSAPDPKGFRQPLGQAVRFLDQWAAHHKIQNKDVHKAILKDLNAGLGKFDDFMKDKSK